MSQQVVESGAPETSYFRALGDCLYHDADRLGYVVHMLLLCMGGILWYSLLLSSGAVPQALSIWGVVAVSVLTIPMLLQLA